MHWVSSFQSTHQGVRINYQSIGSGGGIQQLKQGLVDFGATDAALDDQQLQQMPPLVQIPESAGPSALPIILIFPQVVPGIPDVMHAHDPRGPIRPQQ